MREAALALAVLLIVPAMVAIAARARIPAGGHRRGRPSGGRALEWLWVALPLGGLALLVILAAVAGG